MPQFLDRFPDTGGLTLPQSHCDEVTEIQDTDEHVTNIVNWCVAQIELCQRTLPGQRYAELIESMKVALHDDFPAARQHGDDPFAED